MTPPDPRSAASRSAGVAAEAELDVGVCAATGSALGEDGCLALAPAEQGFPAHLFAVADGLGAGGGDAAARLTLDTLHAEAARGTLDRPESWLRGSLGAADLAVRDRARAHPEGPQSTATVLLLAGDQACVGHVGDCRAYLVRDGAVEQCTSDHTHAAEMVRLRLLSPEQAQTHPARGHLTRSLGAGAALEVDVLRRPLRPGDVWVLCAAGLWGAVPPSEIAAAVHRRHPAEAAHRLVRAARDRGAAGGVRVVVVRVERPAMVAPRPRLGRPGAPPAEDR